MISFFDFSSQLFYSLFEITAAVIILLFGWYFARVGGWWTREFLQSPRFYKIIARAGWDKNIKCFNNSRAFSKISGVFIKWWVFLFFIMVSVALIGFASASHFLEKVLTYSAQGFVAVLLIILLLNLGAKK